jgi:hypothetical protein
MELRRSLRAQNDRSYGIYLDSIRGAFMRVNVSIDKDILDELLKETKARSKVSAVKIAICGYLKRKRIEKIMSMKGKLNFDLTADEIRHYKR